MENSGIETTEKTQSLTPLEELRMFDRLGLSVVWADNHCFGSVPALCRIRDFEPQDDQEYKYELRDINFITFFHNYTFQKDSHPTLRSILTDDFGGLVYREVDDYIDGVALPIQDPNISTELVNFLQNKCSGKVTEVEPVKKIDDVEKHIEIDYGGQKCVVELGWSNDDKGLRPSINLDLTYDQPLEKQIELFTTTASAVIAGLCSIGRIPFSPVEEKHG